MMAFPMNWAAAELAVEADGKRACRERSKIVALGLMPSSKGVGSYGIRTGPGLAADVPLFQRNQAVIRRTKRWSACAARSCRRPGTP
jgi:hypothetical protein